MKKISCLILFLMICGGLLLGQTTTFRYKVYVSKKKRVNQEITIPLGDSLTFKSGTVISSQKKFVNDGVAYVADITDTVEAADSTKKFLADKKVTIKDLSLPGRASITVDKDDKSKLYINYLLNSPYRSDAIYYIKLENREFVRFRFTSLDIGPLVIPFKYRPGFNFGSTSIGTQFTADINAGIYFGMTMGQVCYSYRTNEDRPPTKWMASIGLTANFSRVELDSTMTKTADTPLTEKVAVPAFSPGIGLMFSLREIRMGFFTGYDIGIGPVASKWDFDNKVWVGFGVGYNLFFWGK